MKNSVDLYKRCKEKWGKNMGKIKVGIKYLRGAIHIYLKKTPIALQLSKTIFFYSALDIISREIFLKN